MKSERSSVTLQMCDQGYKTLKAYNQDRVSAEVGNFLQDLYGDMSEGDLKMFLELLCEDALPSLCAFENALAARDLKAAAEKAHRLRNTTAAVGASGLSHYLGDLEEQLRAGTLQIEAFELVRLRQVYEELLQSLAIIRNRLSGV